MTSLMTFYNEIKN